MMAPRLAHADSIFQAMAKAYQNNPDLNAARAGLRATDEGVAIAKSGLRPQIAASLGIQSSRDTGNLSTTVTGVDENSQPTRRTVQLGAVTTNSATAGITLTQPIFDGFQTLNNVRAAKSNVFVGRQQLRGTEISILQAAAQAYTNVGRDKQIVQIRRESLDFLREQLNAADARLKVGEGTRTDVAQARAQLAATRASLQSAIAQEASSEAVYRQIVGTAPSGIQFPPTRTKYVPNSLSTALSVGREENPDILAAQYSVDAQGYQVKSAEGALLPGVNLQGSVDTNNNGITETTVGASVNIPIYQGGAVTGQIRQAKELLGQQRIQVDSTRRQVDQNITSTWSQYQAFKANISAQRESIDAAKLALNGVVEERKVGQSTTLDVLDQQQILLNNQETLVTAQANAAVYGYMLLAYMGRLTVPRLDLNVPNYDPKVHYEETKDRWYGLRTVDGR
ncbi:TolC family outer membrane protein [Pararhizobium mangrovi]|uniref:TolC family outer membrane protein n=2 Tax=Pararhizobium mangrovi TaxID=2590452 RepID=A0A506U667_9HYPH|nr:TolC family outer membrane protein [Pararhizobium mangrovi]